jgi:secondary thiamine-phosphate synthase enzyme
MQICRHTITLATTESIEIVDITAMVREWLRASGIRDGVLTVFSPHTTSRVNINEREVELQRDMVTFLRTLVPRDGAYGHNRAPVDDRDNAHAHLLGLLLNASETIPVADGALVLGGWQSIFFVELDGPRAHREVQLQCMGTGFTDDA